MSDAKTFDAEIAAHANGRTLCNCREAYYDERGMCKYGCSTNLLYASHALVAELAAERDALRAQLDDALKCVDAMLEYESLFDIGNDVGAMLAYAAAIEAAKKCRSASAMKEGG